MIVENKRYDRKRVRNDRRVTESNPFQKCFLHGYMADRYNPCSVWSTMQ
jgi:hypothetical protein